jgi:hypothetical protein
MLHMNVLLSTFRPEDGATYFKKAEYYFGGK